MKYLILSVIVLMLTGCASTIARAVADYRADAGCTTDIECETLHGAPFALVAYHE